MWRLLPHHFKSTVVQHYYINFTGIGVTHFWVHGSGSQPFAQSTIILSNRHFVSSGTEMGTQDTRCNKSHFAFPSLTKKRRLCLCRVTPIPLPCHFFCSKEISFHFLWIHFPLEISTFTGFSRTAVIAAFVKILNFIILEQVLDRTVWIKTKAFLGQLIRGLQFVSGGCSTCTSLLFIPSEWNCCHCFCFPHCPITETVWL